MDLPSQILPAIAKRETTLLAHTLQFARQETRAGTAEFVSKRLLFRARRAMNRFGDHNASPICDPEDGEAAVSWTLLKDEEAAISPTTVERVLARMIRVFCGEYSARVTTRITGERPETLFRDI